VRCPSDEPCALKIRVAVAPRSNQVSIGSSNDRAVCLGFVLEPQQQSNWCWAAIAVSLAHFYGVGRYTQHEVAVAVLGARKTDEELPSDQINTIALLDDALRFVRCAASWSPGRPALREIAREIMSGRPVCVCLQWQTGDAHYVVLTGCDAGSGELTVEDPLHGPSLQQFDTFPRTYRSAGAVWRGSYWTAPGLDG
jgi:hypothetical protein